MVITAIDAKTKALKQGAINKWLCEAVIYSL